MENNLDPYSEGAHLRATHIRLMKKGYTTGFGIYISLGTPLDTAISCRLSPGPAIGLLTTPAKLNRWDWMKKKMQPAGN